MSSTSRWKSADRISLTGTGVATFRNTGCPSRATFRMAMSVPRDRIVPYAPRRSLRPRRAESSSGPLGLVTMRLILLEIPQQGVDVGRRIPEIEELGLDETFVDAALDLAP